MAEFLTEEGIDIRVESKVSAWRRSGTGVVKVESAEKTAEIVGTHVLVAIGRRPNTDDLGLDKAGSPPIRAAISRWMISCAPMCPASGRWAIATGGARYAHVLQ